MGMLFVEEFVRRVLDVDRELLPRSTNFEVYQRLTPAEREALWLAYKAEEREDQLRAPHDWVPFEL
jgi:hypothetical protein